MYLPPPGVHGVRANGLNLRQAHAGVCFCAFEAAGILSFLSLSLFHSLSLSEIEQGPRDLDLQTFISFCVSIAAYTQD
jgi:hypothetical protein